MRVDIAGLSLIVLVAAFTLAVVFGAIAQRTRFCTMGGIADVVNFGDWTRLRQWLLAIAVALAGTTLLEATGLIDLRASFYTTERFTPLSYAVGGLLFGFGMVLAGGCGSRSLVRAGAGSLKSLVALLMLAVFAYISLRGFLAVFRVHVLDTAGTTLATRQDLPSLLAGSVDTQRTWRLALGLGLAAMLVFFVFRERSFRTFDNVLAGIGIGTVIVGVWFVSGTIGHVAEHPQTLEEVWLRTNSRQMESLSFVAPVAWTLDWMLFTSDTSKQLTIGIVSVVGLFAGSFAYALATRSFRWEGFGGTEDTANHLVGGALMGFGGVAALGCTVGQGLSGLSTLALGSFIAVAGIAGGAVLGLRYQAWRLDRSEG